MRHATDDRAEQGFSARADIPTPAVPKTQQELEDFLRVVWAAVLGAPVEQIGLDANFFSLGGDSLLIAQVMDRINTELYADCIDAAPLITEYFAHTTVRALAQRLGRGQDSRADDARPTPSPACESPSSGRGRIAIVGFSGRFPGGADVRAFWDNLRQGINSIRTYSGDELLEAGVAPEVLKQPGYVKSGSVLEGLDRMDAEFFGLTPREAALTCPQQRLLLECAEEALEHAGYGARDPQLRVGVYVSAGHSAYVADHLYRGPGYFESLEGFAVAAINSAPATRISYLLNLTGPSLSIDTACSSSLVDVHQACQSLLNGECDMALAGGASVSAFAPRGYFCEDGGVVSPDGQCRPFDVDARGTVFTSGAGMVLLKRLERAVEDRDEIHAVIIGSAINNDGRGKIGYTAPGQNGQVAVLSEACRAAGIEPGTLQYIETHGTGTPLGDPIEVAALQAVWSQSGQHAERCALGSLKGNIGHTQVAAGISGLIKTTLALKHQEIPPSGGFRALNPAITSGDTSFYINERLQSWTTNGGPRRAGVSSFGIGGTNAHVILEEAPVSSPAPSEQAGEHLLVVSARTESTLRTLCADLGAQLAVQPDVALAEVAYTLQVGRSAHAYRSSLVCRDVREALEGLREASQAGTTVTPVTRAPGIVFMFPGQGSQHLGMLRGLYAAEPTFREHVNRLAEILLAQTGTDILALLGMGSDSYTESDDLARRLAATELCQPLLFVLEYALAQLWMSWGVRPAAMIGHSLGEYVAACVAGVLPPEKMLQLLVQRGRIMASAMSGSMLSVGVEREQAVRFLEPQCSIATVNGPRACVIAGPTPAIARIEAALKARGVRSTRLPTSHAYHSPSMQPVAMEFARVLRELQFAPPRIPYASNLTGKLIRAEEATSADYWVAHMLGTVEFATGIETLARGGPKVFLEVGPGCTLTNLARPILSAGGTHRVVASSRHALSEDGDRATLLGALAKLWQSGISIDWTRFNAEHRGRRVALPTYPFERQRHWIEPHATSGARVSPGKQAVSHAQAREAVVHEGRPADTLRPRTEIEQRLSDLWSQLLGKHGISRGEDFFELGGDSLLAAQMGARSQDVLGRRISPAELLQHRTIARLAELLAGEVQATPA
jgi:acyl transferase domain-containing protein